MAAAAKTEMRLPDLWQQVPGGGHPLLDLAKSQPESALVNAMRQRLDRRADEDVLRALAAAPDRQTYSRLWQALCAAAEGPGAPGDAVMTTVFALPLVIVSGARRNATLPGVLSDVNAVSGELEQAGALGGSRSFGFGNALCSRETLERLLPSTVREWQNGALTDATPRALAPEPVPVRAGEEVHLRFLLGAAVSPAAAPSVIETAAHIGAWGMTLARMLGDQLATQGVDVLVLPRAPTGLITAACRGRRAQLETALDLFLSSAIRRTRAAAGEPSLVLSVHGVGQTGAELRVSVSAALDDTLLEGFRWPLHPLDDPNGIAADVLRFATECRLDDVRFVDTLLAPGGDGARLFVPAREVSRTGF